MKGRTRCDRCGGKTPRGIASPHFKDGTFARHMPIRLREDYQAALADPHLLSLRTEIATHRALAEDLKRRLATDGDATGPTLLRAWEAFKAAQRKQNGTALAAALTALDAAMGRTAQDYAVRAELRREDELVQKLTRAENDRMEQLHQMVSREQALAFMRGLSVSVKTAVETHVEDVDARTRILRAVGAKFEQLTDRRSAEDVGPGGRRLLPAGDPPADD